MSNILMPFYKRVLAKKVTGDIDHQPLSHISMTDNIITKEAVTIVGDMYAIAPRRSCLAHIVHRRKEINPA